MGKIYENECVGCPDNLGCLGSECPKRNVPHYYCDGRDCGDELDASELYDFDGIMLCKACLAKQFKTIEEKER